MASSSRKVGMSKLKQGQRKSPRLSVTQQGPASRTKAGSGGAGKARKFRPPQHTNNVQRINQQSHGDQSITRDQPTSLQGDGSPKLYDDNKAASPEWMPEKRILELILDILQRRDTYEIFAEPVDPEEVEDYYEIIKEPMDFGTMRAKLHEGMYTSLQQFEYDAYLIPTNAMHFNSQTTIYFRQARTIYELAKKVFDSLKTDPEKFELEFSETKRRTNRRLTCEATKAPSSSKLSTNSKPNIKTNLSSKSIRGTCQQSGAATGFDSRDHCMHSSDTDSRRNSYDEIDRRCTYKPDNASIVSPVYGDSNPLVPVFQQGIGYRESLMLFVKDLGPTARMVAERKLRGCCFDDRMIGSRNPVPDCALTNYKVDAGEKGYGKGQMGMSSMGVGSSNDERRKAVNEDELGSKSGPRTQENGLDYLRLRKDEVEARKGYLFDLSFLKKKLHQINSSGSK